MLSSTRSGWEGNGEMWVRASWANLGFDVGINQIRLWNYNDFRGLMFSTDNLGCRGDSLCPAKGAG